MSNIKTFIEQLKADQIVEAFQTIKDELSARARVVAESVNVKVAEGFNMKPIVEKDEKDDDEENLSDEEKEAAKAKEEEEKAKGE